MSTAPARPSGEGVRRGLDARHVGGPPGRVAHVLVVGPGRAVEELTQHVGVARVLRGLVEHVHSRWPTVVRPCWWLHQGTVPGASGPRARTVASVWAAARR